MSLYGAVGPVDGGEIEIARVHSFCVWMRGLQLHYTCRLCIVGHYLEVGILRLL